MKIPRLVKHLKPPQESAPQTAEGCSGTIAVFHTKGGTGGGVITWGLEAALTRGGGHPVVLNMDSPDRLTARAVEGSGPADDAEILLINYQVLIDESSPLGLILAASDAIVLVMDTNPYPKLADEDWPALDDLIPPSLRGDPRLVVVANDRGAAPEPASSPFARDPYPFPADVLRVPFDPQIRGSLQPRFGKLQNSSREAFHSLAAAVIARINTTQ